MTVDARTMSRRTKLEVKLFNKAGDLVRDFGVVSEDAPLPVDKTAIVVSLLLLLLAIGMLHYSVLLALSLLLFGLVTNGGVNYEAAAFGGGPSVDLLNFHDSGTGGAAPAITDSALVSPAGGPRATGLQSVSTNTYRSVGTISYGSVLLITEWGLFSAVSGGILWDRRVFGAIVTAPGDQIQFTYTCIFSPGGI